MATHKLGKLKFNLSKDGLAFRFGDGEIRRLGFGKKAKDEAPDYNEEELLDQEYLDEEDFAGDDYVPGEDFDAGDYSGRFAQPSAKGFDDDFDDYADDYAGDDYEDDGYDDGYEDDYIEDDRYDDGYADEDDYGDDGYDGGYADDDDYYGDDEDGQYDDRYLDEDAEDYGDEGYAPQSPLMQYVDENDWVTYVLLFLLPPLGIYLLWRRRRFEMPIRWAVSAASAVWFIILVILLISAIFSGSGDTTTNPPITMTTPTPTVEVIATPDVGVTSLGGDASGDNLMIQPGVDTDPNQIHDALALDATATPIATYNGSGSSPVSANTVIMTATGLYYHNNAGCSNIEPGASISNVTKDVAQQRGKNPCPICYPDQKVYYATAGGTYYHVEINCSGMSGASVITAEAAKQQGKKECPVCITKVINSLDDSALKYADASTKDRSGVTVFATAGGRYFHTEPNCSGMQNAVSGSLLKAMLAGKTACPKCAASAGTMVWCTEGGKYYHNRSDCSGMKNAYRVTLAEAMIIGKGRCTACWGKSTVGTAAGGAGNVYVYGTPTGKYYHTNSSCSGMQGANRYTLRSMISAGRPACPECCAGAETVVYATANGTYYHSYSSCSGMDNAQAGTLAQALAIGKKKCPKCWAGASGTGTASGEKASGHYVYATQGGTYYHTKSACSGMQGASRITIETAVAAGKKACPTCASAATKKVYSTARGTYYHVKSNCSGMEDAQQRTLEQAIMMGQKTCPVCIGTISKVNSSLSNMNTGSFSSGSSGGISNVKTNTFSSGSKTSNVKANMISSGNYKSGTSGIKVYAVADGKYYHTTSSCSGMKNASRVTLETALNYGKTACSKCASSANTAVFAVKGGKYYHYSKTCAGAGAVQGKRGPALALGLDACPYCVTKTKTITSSGMFKAGTSGIKVYASPSGKYYHANKSCAGASASRITLETALNYSKSACPSCAGSASKRVYAVAGNKYYHSSKTCAGSGAVAGSFAGALALGLKECPVCIGGSEAYEVSDIKYSAPGDTGVYINLDSDMLYYHKGSRCSDAGMSSGTKVMLDFVLNWGYKACPFCAPPTSVKK
ncbi:MAG: hypothetical protein J6J78_06720 [Clostridia bacterium]|nr:hypothetical protein [Clostridia bacterium]